MSQAFVTPPCRRQASRNASRPGKRRLARLEHLEPRLAPAAGSISGVVFNDLNGNGARDISEPGIAGRTVFIDLNQNGQFDPGDLTTTTAVDGSYQFTGLQPGNYLVDQVLPAGSHQTAPQTYLARPVVAAVATPYTFTFAGLAGAADRTIPAYHENGYTFNTTATPTTQFTVFGASNTARYAGSPALSPEWAPSTVSLVRDYGTPFTLNSMDLSTIWSSVYSATVIFTGCRADGTTVQQAFPIGN